MLETVSAERILQHAWSVPLSRLEVSSRGHNFGTFITAGSHNQSETYTIRHLFTIIHLRTRVRSSEPLHVFSKKLLWYSTVASGCFHVCIHVHNIQFVFAVRSTDQPLLLKSKGHYNQRGHPILLMRYEYRHVPFLFSSEQAMQCSRAWSEK